MHYLTDLRDKSFARSDPFLRAVSELLPLMTADSKIDTEHGGILRLHDIRLTAKSLSSVIEAILRNGYKFVPLSYFMMSTYAFPLSYLFLVSHKAFLLERNGRCTQAIVVKETIICC